MPRLRRLYQGVTQSAARLRNRDIPPCPQLHAAPVLAADLEQRVGDLPERADAHRVYQHRKHVLTRHRGLLQARRDPEADFLLAPPVPRQGIPELLLIGKALRELLKPDEARRVEFSATTVDHEEVVQTFFSQWLSRLGEPWTTK